MLEFMSFVIGEASEKCQREKQKTVNRDDVRWALAALGFDEGWTSVRLHLGQTLLNEKKFYRTAVLKLTRIGLDHGEFNLSEKVS
ncbi:hypothetical protein G4B88_026914 [Cannabis sativa]|uniref:Transcription factor CBF/NF-Y/archaeal histone domain-containing protein n=1 Tax=Cannabis sativa TaxID=3483 RepID=A0A7J6EGH0_CANSA|nr:hypothetical protein G4B88_026914 [Cannabis sativa]